MNVGLAMTIGAAVAAATALASLYDLVRRRTRAAVDRALFFVAFAIGVFGVVSGLLDLPLLWFAIVAVSSVSAPYLLLRIAEHFLPVARRALALARLGAAYSWLLNLWLIAIVFRFEGTAASNPTPGPLLALPMVSYLVGTTAYAAWIFVRASVRGSGATMWRARLAATGALCVAAGIGIVAALTLSNRTAEGHPRTPGAALDVYALMLAIAAVAFFLAFASPPWLRQLWRLAELHRFLRATAETSIGERGRESLDALVAATKRATGAIDARVSEDDTPVAPNSIVVAIETAGRRFGKLEATYRREPLFPGDDAAIMRLMAEQTAIALANDQLFRERRELEEREHARVQRELDWVAEELEVARRIQLSLLPREAPALPGWNIVSSYRPARQVGGDFYDFLKLADGSLALVIGDASGHGMPAALVMATTRSELRAAAATSSSPAHILERANANLVGAMPPSTFVTCLVIAIDPTTGGVRFANAGHNAPYAAGVDQVRELRARGMPLGLMPDVNYEELSGRIAPGETLLLYTDGVVEAHGPDGRTMFGSTRLRDLVASRDGELTERVMTELRAFAGPAWEQEDDITLVRLRREPI